VHTVTKRNNTGKLGVFRLLAEGFHDGVKGGGRVFRIRGRWSDPRRGSGGCGSRMVTPIGD